MRIVAYYGILIDHIGLRQERETTKGTAAYAMTNCLPIELVQRPRDLRLLIYCACLPAGALKEV